MSVQQVPMYRLSCDRCATSAQEGDYYAWADENEAREEASESGWLMNERGDWCNDCTVYNESTDEYVPNPEPLQKADAK